ncbi:MAG: hypothetical protein AAGA02_13105 [Bacteroidota bacterium]
MKLKTTLFLFVMAFVMASCGDDDDDSTAVLDIPTEYSSDSYEANVIAESLVLAELATMTSAANDAEENAQGATEVAAIPYPPTLASVTLTTYRELVEDWLVELVNSANDDDGFQNPGPDNTPAMGEEGGLLGDRLLDENGLELEQMVQKGSFGAALYNHALDVIQNEDLTDPGTIDRLVEIHGTSPAFDPDETTAAATYSRRRSRQSTETGAFYDIRTALITARAAIEGGSAFDAERDQALDDYLLAWEKSNFATVIYYCQAANDQISAGTAMQDGDMKDEALGDAMHAYAEGVGFAHGFKGLADKQISDAQIDQILALLRAPEGQVPESYQFLNDATLLEDLQDIIDLVQNIYDFTDAEVTSFFVNDPQ